MNNDEEIAGLLAPHIAASLKHFIADDSMVDDVASRTECLEPEIALTKNVNVVIALVFADERVQEVLKEIVESAVDAATYMRY